MTPFSPREQDRNETKILATILDEFILQLFVYVDGVKGALVVLAAHGSGGHRVVILRADDDYDKVFFLTEISLHEVYFTYASKLLLKNINMSIKTIMSQQSHKVDDLVDMTVAVSFICDKHPPLLYRQWSARRQILLFGWNTFAAVGVTGPRKPEVTWIDRPGSWVVLRPQRLIDCGSFVELLWRALSAAWSPLWWA